MKLIYRLLNPVEAEMDEAIANARSSQGHETFDETYLTELCVKRKYMGHRNARYDLLLSDHSHNTYLRRTFHRIFTEKRAIRATRHTL